MLRDGMGTREITLYVPTEPYGGPMLLAHSTPIGRVRGLVQDSAGRPIANARVLDADESELTRTSEAGAFTLDALPAGDVDLQVRAVGFMPQRFRLTVRPAETLLLDLALDRFAPLMATVTASARRTVAGFHERRGQGRGRFLDAADITKMRPMQVADALRQTPGVILGPLTSFSRRMVVRDRTYGKLCEPSIFVDGVELLSKTENLDAFVNIDDIAAMEVYASAAEVPFEFPGDPYCGAILIWRKGVRSRP